MTLRRLLPALFVALLVVGTVLVTLVAIDYERQKADDQGRAGAARVAEITRLGLMNASGSLADTAGLFDASDEVTARDFETFARRVLGRGPVAELVWIERVDAEGRAAYEASAGVPITEPGRARGERAPARAVHFPVRYVTAEIPTGTLHGMDDSRDPLRREAMERAAALDTPIATPPVTFRGGGQGVVLYQPVYVGGGPPGTAAARRSALRGFVAGTFRLDTLTRRIIRTADAGTSVEIRDGDSLLSAPAAGAADGTRIQLPVAGRRWTILAGHPPPSWGLPVAILVGGSVLTLLGLLLTIVIARRDRFATAAVVRATAELTESRRSHRALSENSPDVVARYDRDLRCTFVNAAIERATGMSPGHFLGRRLADAGLDADLVALLEGALRRVQAGEDGVEVEFAFTSPDGTKWFQSRLAPEPDPHGAIDHVLVVTRDVTRQTLAERALRAGEDRYRVLLESLSDGVVVLDATGAIASCNPAAMAILGLDPGQIARREPLGAHGRPVRSDGTPLPADEHPATVTLRSGRPEHGAVMGMLRPDGRRVWLSVSTRLLVDDGERSAVCCVTDITSRVDADREQAALRRVATLIAADGEPPEVMDLVAREAAALTGAEAAGVVRFDDDRVEGLVVGAHSPGGRAVAAGAWVDLGAPTAVGTVAATGTPSRVGDGVPAHLDAVVPGAVVSSAVAMPIHVEHRVWGAITAVTTRPGEPLASGTDERLARLAELVALAIMSAHNRAQLATLAATDHLTGLPNRRTFTEGLAVEIERARRHGRDVSLVVMDIDHFKRINDTHGHPTGDRVLIGVAARLFADVRDTEMVARVGGEEFAWILPETDGAEAVVAAERLRRNIAASVFDEVGSLTVSMGVCDLRDAGDARELLRLADAALYRAKAEGRDRVVRHTPMPAGAPG